MIELQARALDGSPESSASIPATRAQIERLEKQLTEMKAAIERHEASLKLGLTRMGQLQADIDLIRAVWSKISLNK